MSKSRELPKASMHDPDRDRFAIFRLLVWTSNSCAPIISLSLWPWLWAGFWQVIFSTNILKNYDSVSTFLPHIWEYLFVNETYIHFLAQETRIIRKLFIFIFFFIKKGRNRLSNLDNKKYISLNQAAWLYHDLLKLVPIQIQLLHCWFRPFWWKNKKMNTFLIIWVSWATKWI